MTKLEELLDAYREWDKYKTKAEAEDKAGLVASAEVLKVWTEELRDAVTFEALAEWEEARKEFTSNNIKIGRDSDGQLYISAIYCDVRGDVHGDVHGEVRGNVFEGVRGHVFGGVRL